MALLELHNHKGKKEKKKILNCSIDFLLPKRARIGLLILKESPQISAN